MQTLLHRNFRDDKFWQWVPAWQAVSASKFADYRWQFKHTVTKISELGQLLADKVAPEVMDNIQEGLRIAPMNIRLSPYILSLINWQAPLSDPIAKQFLPFASHMLSDHPLTRDDSLSEVNSTKAPYIVHRYPDKVLFLPLTACPVYCTYCTRAYLVGGSTESKQKTPYGPKVSRWKEAFEYLKQQEQIEDVVISGGDAYLLTPRHILEIGQALLAIPHIRRIRFATKGLAVVPMRILSDDAWFNALQQVVNDGRKLGKSVAIHTHFSHPSEITKFSFDASQRLFSAGITVRNQCVLLQGINDNVETMVHLIKKLSYMNIQPYYVYMHDMVSHCEHLRTTLRAAIELEKKVRGATAGFNTPSFVCDLPGGGGKRLIHSYESYDEVLGISVWRSPSISQRPYYYYDPISQLSDQAKGMWHTSADQSEVYRLMDTKLNREVTEHEHCIS